MNRCIEAQHRGQRGKRMLFNRKVAAREHILKVIMITVALVTGFSINQAQAVGPVRIISVYRDLDADLGTINQNGTKVQLWDWWAGQNQQWLAEGGYIRNGTIVNVQSGKCLDADLGTINQNGTKVQLWDCWGGSNQKWELQP